MPIQKPVPLKAVSAEALEGDLVLPDSPLYGLIWINPQRMSGTPCFFGTRVPVKTLFEYLEGSESLDSFLDGFPEVLRKQAIAVLELAREKLMPLDRAA